MNSSSELLTMNSGFPSTDNAAFSSSWGIWDTATGSWNGASKYPISLSAQTTVERDSNRRLPRISLVPRRMIGSIGRNWFQVGTWGPVLASGYFMRILDQSMAASALRACRFCVKHVYNTSRWQLEKSINYLDAGDNCQRDDQLHGH